MLHFLTEALNEDARGTTHPIAVPIKHTNDAVNNYDKICYRKGANFLKQIEFYIGCDILRDGIRMYFDKF